MFVVAKTKDQTITWPVTVEVAADGGKTVKHTFTGIFKKLDEEEREALFKDGEDDLALDSTSASATEAAVDNILKVMTDWKQVVDEHKAPIDFNRDTLLIAVRSAAGFNVLQGIWNAMREIRVGARAKN
jgi:hypothetical protein